MSLRDPLIPQYSNMIYNGFWFAPGRVLAGCDYAEQKNITGEVRCKLYKGNCLIVGRRSPALLRSGWYVESDDVYNQATPPASSS